MSEGFRLGSSFIFQIMGQILCDLYLHQIFLASTWVLQRKYKYLADYDNRIQFVRSSIYC